MKKFRYILLVLAVSTVWGCMKEIDTSVESTTSSSSVVELTEDGRYQVTAQLEGVSMTSVVTRATADENRIYDGWCLVFGEDEDNVDKGNYSDDSPLIQLERVTVNANGTFTMVFDEYPKKAFMRIVVNLTDREDYNLENNITSWRMVCTEDGVLNQDKFNTPPNFTQVEDNGIATFGQYRHQSVGLDGIYDVTYKTTSTIVEYGETVIDGTIGGFTTDADETGYKDVVDYSDYGNPKVTSVVQYSVNYQTDGGEEGTSTVTGLPETYNTNQPDPSNPKTTGFPMASYGFVMDEISETYLNAAFGQVIDMIRVCSKVQVAVEDADFAMEEVYLIGAAQESRIRSSVLESSNVGGTTNVLSSFSIPVNLGGTINYPALSTDDKASNPIYFYPNSGGGYIYSDGAVNQNINPQYIIIKGQSSNYDTPGYYKVALKAQYPLDATDDDNLSALTYDILRNTSFTVNLIEIDKPGYKTYEDAADPDSPANNISYSMIIDTSDNRYEVLVSKGTYYVELETSRVYVKGYMDEGIKDCYVEFTMTPSKDNTVPTVYVQSNGYEISATDGSTVADYDSEDVAVTHCLVMRDDEDDGYESDDWTKSTQVDLTDNDTDDGLGSKLVQIDGSDKATKVRVYYDVKNSGRLRLRIGDILKFIPVTYDRIPISIYGTIGQDGTVDNGVVVKGTYGTTWSDFSYSKVEYDEDYYEDDAHDYKEGFKLTEYGTVTYENTGDYDTKPELRARIYPKDAGDGNAVLYLRQASDFELTDDDGDPILPQQANGDPYEIIFNSQSVVKSNNTGGLFTTNSDDTSVTCDISSLETLSVDAVTITIENEITTNAQVGAGNVGSEVQWAEYFNSVYTNDGKTLTLSADKIDYEITSTLDVSSLSGTNKGTARQSWLTTDVRPYLVTYDNTATSTVKITNVAGDYKEYIVKQTQYPPLYFIDASGEGVKQYSFEGEGDTATLFALNVWNSDQIYGYSSNNSTYGYTSSYVYDAVASTTNPFVYKADYAYVATSSKNGQSGMRLTTTKPFIFKKAFLNNYDWDSSDDESGTAVTTTALGGSTKSITPCEMWLIGGDQYADAVIGIIRNGADCGISSLSTNVYYAMMEITITVRDIYEDTYTITKKLCGTETTGYDFVYPTADTWSSRWSSFIKYGWSTWEQSTYRVYNEN